MRLDRPQKWHGHFEKEKSHTPAENWIPDFQLITQSLHWLSYPHFPIHMFNRIQTHRLTICTSEKGSIQLYTLQCTVMHPEEVCDVTDTGSLNKQILQPCSIYFCASNTLNCRHILWMYGCLQWYRNKPCTQKNILLSCHGLPLNQFPNTWCLPTWHKKPENVWMQGQSSSKTWQYQKQNMGNTLKSGCHFQLPQWFWNSHIHIHSAEFTQAHVSPLYTYTETQPEVFCTTMITNETRQLEKKKKPERNV